MFDYKEITEYQPAPIKALRWKRIGSHEFSVPTRATVGSAGFDLYWSGGAPSGVVALKNRFYLYPNERATFPVGWAVEIPDGYVGLIRERRSRAKNGIAVRGGVINADDRGEIHIMLAAASGGAEFAIEPGRAIAQMIVIPCLLAGSTEVDELGDTVRGEGGFGSTGR